MTLRPPSFLCGLLLTIYLALGAGCTYEKSREDWLPPVREITEAPVLSPEESLDSLVVPPNFRVEIADVRKATAPRNRPWADRELELMVHSFFGAPESTYARSCMEVRTG